MNAFTHITMSDIVLLCVLLGATNSTPYTPARALVGARIPE